MTLYLVTDAFRKLGSPGIKNDDFYDRLSRKYSMILLGVSFLIVSSSQFVGHPINCYTQNVAGSHVGYVNWVCWISSSYYVPFDQPLPTRYQRPPEKMYVRQRRVGVDLQLSFSVLVRIINGSLSFCFAWCFSSTCPVSCGVIWTRHVALIQRWSPTWLRIWIRWMEKNVNRLSDLWRNISIVRWRIIENTITDSCKSLFLSIRTQRPWINTSSFVFIRYNVRRRLGAILCCSMGRHSGNYLALTYVLVKFLYIGNAIGQLFLLNLFMGRGFSLLGIETIQRWMNGQDMAAADRFPRITMCKFTIRTLGDNIQPYDVQCLLPINIYNEKVSSPWGLDRWSTNLC